MIRKGSMNGDNIYILIHFEKCNIEGKWKEED